MSKTIVALDCMGGDNAPFEIVRALLKLQMKIKIY